MYFIEVSAPWKPARYVEALPVNMSYVSDGRRNYRVGTSAFECLRVANRQRRLRTRRLVESGYVRLHHHDSWLKAQAALAAMPPDD